MAIKIDLLPGHVRQRRNLQLAIMASVLALALVGTGLAMAHNVKQKELLTTQENLAVVKAIAEKTTAAEGAQKSAEDTMKPISDTIAFMLASSKSGPQRAALLNQVRQYIYVDTVVKSIDLSDGQQAVIQGVVKNPTEYAQFLFNLRRAGPPPEGAPTTDAGPLFGKAPTAAGVKGFGEAPTFVAPAAPTDQPVVIVYPLPVEAKGPLKYPIPVIPDPVSAAPAAGGAGAPGAPGGPGGPGGAPPV